MPGKHKNPTIAFRPLTSWQYALIDERVKLSGMQKKDFICRSIIYSNICMVGKKENIRIIVNAVEEMQYTMKEIVKTLSADEFSLSDDTYLKFKNDLLALAITVVDILNGAAYLFDKKPISGNQHWKSDLEMEQLKDCLAPFGNSENDC